MKTPNAMPIIMVGDDQQFSALCRQWSQLQRIAFDTEFVRTNTFFPRMGLLQVADSKACYLIDPLSINDWSSFRQLLVDSSCELVLHSCGEDLNLVQTAFNYVPARIFDTQIAAAFLGLGFSLSYQALVLELLGLQIAKDETRSDWLKRPLSETQLQYAAIDVCHLRQLAEQLEDALASAGKLEWFRQECEALLQSPAITESPAAWESSYTNISSAWRLDDVALGKLKFISSWRENTARKRNKPKSWIAKDADLLAIAAESGKQGDFEFQQLADLKLSSREIARRYGSELVNLLNANTETDVVIDRDALVKPLSPALRKKLKLCQQAASEIAAREGLSPELLAKKKQIHGVLQRYELSGRLEWLGELAGWRKELLADKFDSIICGPG